MVLLFALLSMLFPQEEATIVFAGDAMQHKSQLENASRGGGVPAQRLRGLYLLAGGVSPPGAGAVGPVA